jgi:hypothetical protein
MVEGGFLCGLRGSAGADILMSSTSIRPPGTQTIRQLAEQLAHWGESLIAHGRSPFRKIETFPTLLTPCGCQKPPLVFWINRDSFMAGAVILFPDENDSSSLETGRCFAQALGLAYFVTWTADKIVFWDARPAVPTGGKHFKLQTRGKTSPEDFQEALQKLMEEAKVMAVIGAVPPPELSAHYLANLYLTTLLGVRPALVDAYRVARAGHSSSGDEMPAEILADQKNILTLVRLLSLILQNQGSMIAQPEDLESALLQSLGTLPESLSNTLQPDEGEIVLPDEAAVRFHLLYRRLTQLRTATDPDRHCQALNLLLEHESPGVGCHPLPFPVVREQGLTLLLNPSSNCSEIEKPLEVAPRSVLAMTALLRHLQEASAATGQVSDIWQLPSSAAPRFVNGTLADCHVPDPDRRRTHLARLRTSWPTRRFQLPPKAPEWCWQFLHLLGIAAEGATIELRVPDLLPTADFGRPLIQLIQEQFTLDLLERERDGWLLLRIFKSPLPDHLTRFPQQDFSVRQIPWQMLRETHPAILALALTVSEELFTLLDAGRLRFLKEDSWVSEQEEALFLYTRSSLGNYLWQLVTNGRNLPSRRSFRQDLPAVGLPVPESAGLSHLQRQFGENGGPPPSSREIDRELASWLGRKLSLPVSAATNRSRSGRQVQQDKSELADQIGELVFVDGIPRFPDHYLFDYYRPELMEFAFDGPLTAEGQFFDTFELRDTQGNSLRVEGAETAKALLLASAPGSGAMRLALPRDRQIVAAMLERYLADLRELHQTLLQETHRLKADPQAADKLAETIWKKHNLPPWSLISDGL